MKEATEFLILARMRNSVASECKNRFFLYFYLVIFHSKYICYCFIGHFSFHTFRPNANAGSSLQACFQPLQAKATV